ncbi:MAG: hemolysin III family protein [Acidobacteria bacterium]|nr:hemolysin III family protein [Acidobacteriota bacterium]
MVTPGGSATTGEAGRHGPVRHSGAEELANAATHGIGVLAGIPGLVILVSAAARTGDARKVVASAVFGAALVLLFLSSTLYHAIPSRRAKGPLRSLDHAAIFLLIAGTYTPFTLVSLGGAWGWSLFGTVWGLAILGIVGQSTVLRRFPRLELALYLGMGWAVVVAVRPLVAALPTGGLILLAAGGLAYTLGTVFYVWESLPHHHAMWHLFVLAGAALHYFAVLLYVIPKIR